MADTATPETTATDPYGRPLGGQLERDGRLLAAAQGIDLTAGHADNANRQYWYERATFVYRQLRVFGRDDDVDIRSAENRQLREQVAAALALHHDDGDGTCAGCGLDSGEEPWPWPCDTVRALGGAR